MERDLVTMATGSNEIWWEGGLALVSVSWKWREFWFRVCHGSGSGWLGHQCNILRAQRGGYIKGGVGGCWRAQYAGPVVLATNNCLLVCAHLILLVPQESAKISSRTIFLNGVYIH